MVDPDTSTENIASEEGLSVAKRVSSEENPTYPLTKGLIRVKHLQHARRISLKEDISFSE